MKDKNITKVTSIAAFLEWLIPEINEFSSDNSVYRGQNSVDYTLTPSLFRITWGGEYGWRLSEQHITDSFKRQALPHIGTPPTSRVQWLIHAQHYGFPTRLLDWTSSPLVALFFALYELPLEKMFESQNDCVVWRMRCFTKYFGDDEGTYFKKEHSNDGLLYPNHTNSRITAQKGLFTIHELPKDNHPFVPLEERDGKMFRLYKCIIPAKFRKHMMLALLNLGVDPYMVYPDLDGLSQDFKLKSDIRKLL